VEHPISVRRVAEQPVAVIRAEIPHGEIAERLRSLYDRVYACVQRGEITPGGHDVILYRDGRPGKCTETGPKRKASFERTCSSARRQRVRWAQGAVRDRGRPVALLG